MFMVLLRVEIVDDLFRFGFIEVLLGFLTYLRFLEVINIILVSGVNRVTMEVLKN